MKKLKGAVYTEIEKIDRERSSVEGDVGGTWESLNTGMLNAPDKVYGCIASIAKHERTWWWSEEVDVAVREKRKLFRAWKKRGGCRELHLEVKCRYKGL